ncbi:hypothetical protein EV189_3304 [Motilibacter rhizosphaerae]|uniref:Pyridoxal phosphate homeostasis protein n=1 Tax=Motilibacter rhizosphaerae TaxID=598652 RepID=A0A4Q7NG47_9ACTN|nr:YggS family pyridoxal phosphate-dependent enzyme [Motilibacter rhizosphaerae]RZS82907.1 hypothetical protein EV189_3304 [Motilibacter rhizosphaerae]
MTGRPEELAARLEEVRTRIAAACAGAGREPGSVTLVAVTKTHPASDVRVLAGLGVGEVAENREQEARPKHAECADLGLRWRFVGQLQTNKAAAVAGFADVVESVDRQRLVAALARAAERRGRALEVLLQVALDPPGAPGRGGAAPEDVPALAEAVAGEPALVLGGLMAVAPRGADPAPAFAVLAGVHARLLREHPSARVLSAGMSGDLEQAVAAGATHVRIGSALLGNRPALR